MKFEKEDCIVKVGNKWRILGNKVKYWNAESDTKKDAQAALRAYWTNKKETITEREAIMKRREFKNEQQADLKFDENGLYDLLFDDFEPTCRHYARLFTNLKTKINKNVDNLDELRELEDKLTELSKSFEKELLRISDITKKYKEELEYSVYKKAMNQFALRHFDVRKQEKAALDALKDCNEINNKLLLKSSRILYWSRILENGKWIEYKEWSSLESLSMYLYSQFKEDTPNIFIDRIDFEPSRGNIGRKFMYNTRMKTVNDFIKAVKKLLNVK